MNQTITMSIEAQDTDYHCPACKHTFGYYDGDSECLRCDSIFDGSLANCSKCGGEFYNTKCPDCGAIVETYDE